MHWFIFNNSYDKMLSTCKQNLSVGCENMFKVYVALRVTY